MTFNEAAPALVADGHSQFLLAEGVGCQPQSDHGISRQSIHRGLGVSGGFDRRSSILGRENLQAHLSEGRPVFRFSIRDVLWLTVVVALAVGWGLDRVQFSREQVNARRAELRARMEAERAVANEQLVRAATAKLQAATSP